MTERLPERTRTPTETGRPVLTGSAGSPKARTQGAASSERPKVDICFVFDTTGSMRDKIDGLTNDLGAFISKDLPQLGLNWRIACIPFGDLTVDGDRVDRDLPFVTTVAEATTQLRQLPRFSGGSNWGESSIDAMDAGLMKPYRSGAVRVIVLVTDEPALNEKRASEIDLRLTQGDFICFAATHPTEYFKAWANHHGGEWVEIGSTMSTAALVAKLREQLPKVARVARAVHDLAEGSVSKYLALPPAARRDIERR